MTSLMANMISAFTQSNMKSVKSFEETEKERYYRTLLGSDYLYGDSARGRYVKEDGNVVYPRFILQDGSNNVFSPIRDKATHYFSKEINNIKWWSCKECGDDGTSPTRHIMSSQVACINHLFAIRENPAAVRAIAQAIDPEITEVVLLENDKEGTRGYISFEVVSKIDHLNEDFKHTGVLERGEFCTSVDALILGIRNHERIMLVIEWKYTESYKEIDKSKEDGQNNPKGSMKSGDTRLRCYTDLILNSKEINRPISDDLRGSVFFYEPFYQLMRQTLWAEQMIKHKETEIIKADDYIHVHVIPSQNKDLLDKIYPVSQKNMEATWREQITHQNKYRIITPEDLFKGLNSEEFKSLFCYLKNRYWACD